MTRRWALVTIVACGVPAWGEPPAPEYYARVAVAAAGATMLEVSGRVQFVPADSLDLVRTLPAAGRLPRLEAMLSAEAVVLHPREAARQFYRTLMPDRAPLGWSYELQLATAPGLPQVAGSDYLCAWMGGVLLAPQVPGHRDSSAVVRLFFGAGSNDIPAYGPWPRHDGLFWPASLDDLVDGFLALGNWRVSERVVASACTLQVAIAGTLPVTDEAWGARLSRDLAAQLPRGGRALVCVAPAPGDLAVHRARRSWLVLWPPSRAELPREPLPPGRHPLEPPAPNR
jgi:hypothetical protein